MTRKINMNAGLVNIRFSTKALYAEISRTSPVASLSKTLPFDNETQRLLNPDRYNISHDPSILFVAFEYFSNL